MITTKIQPHSLFEAKTKELQEIHKDYEKAVIICKKKTEKVISELITIIHENHPDWSIRRIAYAIVGIDDSIIGFTHRSLYQKIQTILNKEEREREI